jgi:hypothetical protein
MNNNLSSDIEKMKQKELSFYQEYGTESYEEFRDLVRKVFEPNDRAVFLKF